MSPKAHMFDDMIVGGIVLGILALGLPVTLEVTRRFGIKTGVAFSIIIGATVCFVWALFINMWMRDHVLNATDASSATITMFSTFGPIWAISSVFGWFPRLFSLDRRRK